MRRFLLVGATVRHPGSDGRRLQEAGARPGSRTGTTSGCAAATATATTAAAATAATAPGAADRGSDLREEDGRSAQRRAAAGRRVVRLRQLIAQRRRPRGCVGQCGLPEAVAVGANHRRGSRRLARHGGIQPRARRTPRDRCEGLSREPGCDSRSHHDDQQGQGTAGVHRRERRPAGSGTAEDSTSSRRSNLSGVRGKGSRGSAVLPSAPYPLPLTPYPYSRASASAPPRKSDTSPPSSRQSSAQESRDRSDRAGWDRLRCRSRRS